MMNNIFRKVSLFTVVLFSCLMMQSCLEEELPKDYATGSQVQGSETAQQGLLTGLSACLYGKEWCVWRRFGLRQRLSQPDDYP